VLVFAVLLIAVWFLPSILALFLKRKQLGQIFLANVPAGISWLASFAVLAWAVTGEMRNKKGGENLVITRLIMP